ncbi:MAG: hypothetical protein AAAB16_23445 [Pseudomonas sp.]|uniref:hypothetical protein n=1 Tax=Pseudomonas sp. TaxID=306 RepID=UPI0030F1B9B6
MRRSLLRSFAALLCVHLLNPITAYAQPVAWVYRIDTRPPEDVFVNGFSSGGEAPELLGHVFYGECAADVAASRSVWVSTTADRDWAMAFARRQRPMPGTYGAEDVWLYRIHTDDTYLDVSSILAQVISAGRQRQDGYLPQQANLLEYLIRNSGVAGRREVVTRRVRPENIFAASQVLAPAEGHGDGQMVLTPLRMNSGYLRPTTRMSDEVVLQDLIPTTSIRLYQSNQTCVLDCDGGTRSQRKRRSPTLPSLNCAAEPNRARALIGSED